MSVVDAQRRHQPIWPLAVIVVGLGLAASWTALLAYGVVTIIEYAL